MENALPHKFIVIEGNIGAGKTTLSQLVARDYGCRLILEQFSDNPFLPLFYDNPERYAFSVELFFMTERHKQLQDELKQTNLFQQGVVADYFFVKTLLFAKNNLSEEEYRLFQRLFHILNAHFPKPDLLVYLHRPVEALLANIQRRGRSFESDISPGYLAHIQQAYLDFFRGEPSFPILLVELNDLDFSASPQVYQNIVALLHKEYPNGLHQMVL
ncbi:MAG: deoxynucleoside kinase [Saprospiraceae bacterium]|jgi:deoxyguanosine kinase